MQSSILHKIDSPGGMYAESTQSLSQELRHFFLQALHKNFGPLRASSDARLAAQQQPALLGFLPELIQLYDGLRASEELPDAAALVHDRLNLYRYSSPDFQAATAAQLLHECRALRRAMLTLLSDRRSNTDARDDLGHTDNIDLVHELVDACVNYTADAFVHEEELLRQSRNEFAEIIDTLPQLVWRTTIDGEATFANKPFLEHVGCTLEQVLGWGWLAFIHPDDRPGVASEWQRCRDRQSPVSVAFRMHGKDGAYRWFLSLGNPFFDSTQTMVAYYGTWTDIDEYKQIEARLKQAISVRDNFLCIASHELKTPLTALQLQVQMRLRTMRRAGEGSVPTDRVEKMLDSDAHQLARITRLVNDMLDVSRIESGSLSLDLSPVDLAALVRGSVERHQALLEASGCAVQVRCCARLEGCWDAFRLEQVLTNLLSNCSLYAPKSHVDIVLERAGDQAVLVVADDGPGIAKAHQGRIFGRFERAISASERSGLGLGLYLVRQILARHGGEIRLDSALGGGCRFTITLPLNPMPQASRLQSP